MYENIFRRYEQKYLITKSEMEKLLKQIKPHIEPDVFFESQILNIYFDNDNSDMIIDSLEKPAFKVKIRARNYYIDDNIFLELKTKYNGIVEKRRIKLSLKEFNEYIYEDKFAKDNQIMKEIDYYMNLYQLKPSIFIAYNRLSYKAKQDTYLRITFDSDLKSRRNNLEFKYDESDLDYDNDLVIMEVKTLGSLPKWLVDILSKYKIHPNSFSKYGKIYAKEILKGDC